MKPTADWWRTAVIYVIYPRSFADADGDGLGDLRGITARLDYLAELGVDALWLSPFFPSPQADFGYDVADYCAVDPGFGSLADVDALVAGAHRRGLKVMLDLVLAHSSEAHPWFRDSRRSRSGPRADWYVWADPRPDGTPPNNWLGIFGGGAWSWEPRRRQYYLHHFLSAQPKLNLRHPELRRALAEVVRFWTGRGIDGFRFDAVDFMLHDPALSDNPVTGEAAAQPFYMQRHLHDMAHADTLPFLAWLRDTLGDAVGLAEIGADDGALAPLARAAAVTAPGRLQLAYTLALINAEGAAGLRRALAEIAAVDARLCFAFSSQDAVRVVSRWGDGSPAAAKALLALLLALPGAVCLYQGEELGLTQARLPFEALRDPYGIAFWPEYEGRDGCRTPMPWTDEAPARSWLPMPEDHLARAVSLQDREPGSVLATARALLAWRKTRPELRDGAFTPVPADGPVVAFERGGAAGRLLCVFNLSAAPARQPCPGGRPLAPAGLAPARWEDGVLHLPPWGASFVAAT